MQVPVQLRKAASYGNKDVAILVNRRRADGHLYNSLGLSRKTPGLGSGGRVKSDEVALCGVKAEKRTIDAVSLVVNSYRIRIGHSYRGLPAQISRPPDLVDPAILSFGPEIQLVILINSQGARGDGGIGRFTENKSEAQGGVDPVDPAAGETDEDLPQRVLDGSRNADGLVLEFQAAANISKLVDLPERGRRVSRRQNGIALPDDETLELSAFVGSDPPFGEEFIRYGRGIGRLK